MRERRLSGKWKAGRLLSAFFPSAALLLGRQSELRKLAQGSLPTALQYASLAEIELTVGLTAQARCLLSNGVKLFPNNPTLWNLLLGAAEVECHHPTKATVDFDRAISLGLRYVDIYLKEFEGAYNPHILSQTLKTNHQLLQFNPWNAEGNFQFELVALEKGDFGDCLGHVKKIPESHRNNPRVRAVLCADLAATEQVNRARREAAHCWKALTCVGVTYHLRRGRWLGTDKLSSAFICLKVCIISAWRCHARSKRSGRLRSQAVGCPKRNPIMSITSCVNTSARQLYGQFELGCALSWNRGCARLNGKSV
jgi:hypothetical protein